MSALFLSVFNYAKRPQNECSSLAVIIDLLYSTMDSLCINHSFQTLLLAVIGVSSIVITDSATKPPLMFSKWPPTYQNNKPTSLRHQMFHQLRSSVSGRLPSPSMIVKRYPSQQMSVMMRPMKYPQLKKTPIPQPSYYKPTISTPPRYRFQSSASASNVGEYIFENPFNNLGIPHVRIPIDSISIHDAYFKFLFVFISFSFFLSFLSMDLE